jgi:calcineurin-like phosphoesterase family protein
MDYITADLHLGHANIIEYCKRPFLYDEIIALKAELNNCTDKTRRQIITRQLNYIKLQAIQQMNDTLIGNINKVVNSDDTLWIVGDFSMSNIFETVMNYRKRINCKHTILIRGNHDYLDNEDYGWIFHQVLDYKEFKYHGNLVVLSHYAMRVWNKAHRGAWHLYGHSHGTLPDLGNKSFDVGVDCWNYKPLSMTQIEAEMSKRTFKPVDGHGDR